MVRYASVPYKMSIHSPVSKKIGRGSGGGGGELKNERKGGLRSDELKKEIKKNQVVKNLLVGNDHLHFLSLFIYGRRISRLRLPLMIGTDGHRTKWSRVCAATSLLKSC